MSGTLRLGTLRLNMASPHPSKEPDASKASEVAMVSKVPVVSAPVVFTPHDYRNDPERQRAEAILSDSKMGTILEKADLGFILDVLVRHPDIDQNKPEAGIVVVGEDAEGGRRHFRMVYLDNTFICLDVRECFNPLFRERRERIRLVREAHARSVPVHVDFKVGDSLEWSVDARRATAAMVMPLGDLPPPIPGGGGPISISAEEATLMVPLRTRLHRKAWFAVAETMVSGEPGCMVIIHGHLEPGNTLSDVHAAIQKPYKPAEPQPPVP